MGSVGQYTQGWLPWMGHKAATGFDTRANDSTALGMGYFYNSGSAQNDEVSWDVWLDVGTWKLALVYGKNNNRGIFSAQLDAVEQGTIDSYNAATSLNNYTEITGISVTVAGLKTFKLKMATKNGSSTNYQGLIQSSAWVRTSGTSSIPAGSDTPGYTWHYLPWMGTKTATASTASVQNSGLLGGGRTNPGTGVQNDEMTWDIWLDTGTYKVANIFFSSTDAGIGSQQLDAVEKATIDQYNAAGADDTYTEVTGITVSTAGVKNYKVKAANKNGSSTGYFLRIQSVAWIRTGA